MSAEEIYKKQSSAVVRIEARLNGKVLSLGTGFFTSDDGEILTNYHVLRPWLTHPKVQLSVELVDGKVYRDIKTETCSRSHKVDACRIKIQTTGNNYFSLRKTKPIPGEPVVVIGHPLGLSFSISRGILSALRVHPAGWQEVQIDAPINPGNSGGPIIDRNGLVVGMVYQFEKEGQNLNFGLAADEILNLKPARYLPIHEARANHYRVLQASAKIFIQKRVLPLQSWLKYPSQKQNSSFKLKGFRWREVPLKNKRTVALLPDNLQACERLETADSDETIVCTSMDLAWSLTFKKVRVGSKKFNPALLSLNEWQNKIVTHQTPLRGLAVNSLGSSNGFSPWISNQVADSDLKSWSTQSICRTNPRPHQSTVCEFSTYNDKEPGAVSINTWIQDHNDRLLVQIWTAEPALTELAKKMAELFLMSSGWGSF